MLAFHTRSVRSLRIALVLCCAPSLATSAGAQVNFKLNGPLARSHREGFWMGDVRISPDGVRVVYAAALDSEARGLFTVRLDGSEPPVRLVPVGTFHSDFAVSSACAAPLGTLRIARGSRAFSAASRAFARGRSGASAAYNFEKRLALTAATPINVIDSLHKLTLLKE